MMAFEHCILFLLKALPTVVLASTCPATKYSGNFRSEDYEKDKAIIGHSYKNLTVHHAQECFGCCVSDCKCQSFQISGTRCELLDEDTYGQSVKLDSRVGYKYYQLKQHFKYNSVECLGICRNGCCRTNLCMHGGTCVETCEDTRRKFKCLCPLSTRGRYCQFVVSCVGIPGKPKSGVHTITGPSLSIQIKVYCDFTSEPGFVWTLVESFEYSKKERYFDWMFFENHPVNEGHPNWVNYRMSLDNMKHIRINATHWRATCNYKSASMSTIDYVRVDMNARDIMQPVSKSCHHVDFLRLLGTTCTGNCKSFFRHDSYHAYFIPCYADGCKSVKSCPNNSYTEAFGAYEYASNGHHCSSSLNSTTNWWFGYKLN